MTALRTGSFSIASSALWTALIGLAVLVFTALFQGRLDQGQVTLLVGFGAVFLVFAALGVVLRLVAYFGIALGLDSAELRYTDCINCHHDFVMKDETGDEHGPGDCYRIEVRNRTLRSLKRVTLHFDSAKPPILGAEVKMRLMNDLAPYTESTDGVTIAPGRRKHWTVVAMHEDGPRAHKPFVRTMNGDRYMQMGTHYVLRFHAESNHSFVAETDFEVYFTDDRHMRFRRVDPDND